MAISLGGMVLVKSKTLSWILENGQKFQTLSGKYETLSAEWQKSQTVSGKLEPMLSWSHYCEVLETFLS